MRASFAAREFRSAFSAITLIVGLAFSAFFADAASAQMCPQPYAQAVSEQTGNVCTSTCAAGSYPAAQGSSSACAPGYAPPTCPDGNSFLVMTSSGPTCQKGYVPVAGDNNSFACKQGDLRVERPPYQLNGALSYETCAPAPNCPSGYIETVDPDNALGASRVCMLPCQDFVMNQGMACSCGSGGRLAAQQPGAPVEQICQRMCPAGSQWQATSPLYAFQAQQGQCVSASGGEAIAPPATSPSCPGASYWNGETCIPMGGVSGGLPIITYFGCPTGTHWNGSHCVPNSVRPPICRRGTFWNGFFCVPKGPRSCPPTERWDGNKCIPIVVKTCPPNQYWNGTECVPKPIVCVPPTRLENGKCVSVPVDCLPPRHIVNGQCVPPTTTGCVLPNRIVNGQCVPPPTTICAPPRRLVDGKCEDRTPTRCPPPLKLENGKCVSATNRCEPPKVMKDGHCIDETPPKCEPPLKLENGACVPDTHPCLPPLQLKGGKCV